MEFDYACTMIQGLLRSLQKTIGVQFSDINRDHDDEIQLISNALDSLAKEMSLQGDSLKKAHMLLLLNTKWEHSAYFDEDEHFCHLLNCVPTLSPFLYFKLTSLLGWHEFLGEVVLHMPEFFVREIVSTLEPELKYIEPKNAVQIVYSLLSNLFHKLMYLQENCQNRLTEFVKLFTEVVKFDFEELSEHEKHHYLGYVYRMYLDLIEFCIEKFGDSKIVGNSLYAHSCKYNYDKWPRLKTLSCRGKHCLGLVAKKCIAISDNISIDAYLSWTEVEMIENGVEKTLQMCVRESAYKARHAISMVPDLHNTIAGLTVLENRLKEIELKPTTEDDEIAKADADTILLNLFNPKMNQKKWLRGLINIGVFESGPHMKVVAENAKLIDVEGMNYLLNSAVKYLSTNSIKEDEHEVVRNMLKTCLKALEPSDQLTVLSVFIRTYCLTTPLLSPTFGQRITFLFNRIVDDGECKEEIYSEMVWLAIEDCEILFKRAFNECLASKSKLNIILDLIRFIAPATDVVQPQTSLSLALSHILTLAHSVKESPISHIQEDFLSMLEVVCEMEIISAENLLYSHIMPLLEPAVGESKTKDINFYLSIILVLEQFCKPSKSLYIAILIRILNRFRPKINNFSIELVQITEKSIELLENAMKLIDSKTNGMSWLKSMAEKSTPLTTQYLQPVLQFDNENKEAPETLFWASKGLGHGKQLLELSDQARSQLVTSIVKILPSLTMKEWERIGDCQSNADFEVTLCTFNVLVDCLLVLGQVPAMLKNLLCFDNVVTNFCHFTKVKIVPKLKSKRGLKSVGPVKNKLELICANLPEDLEQLKRPLFLFLEQSLKELRCKEKPQAVEAIQENGESPDEQIEYL